MPHPSMIEAVCQMYPSKPKFTEKNLPDLTGKVYVVTGANTGVGKELAQILHAKNGNVWVAARSEEKAQAAISAIQQANPDSTGKLTFMKLDLADLTTIKASAKQFTDKESRLDVLFNNAGVMNPAAGSKSAQGYELQLGVNNVGTFMFTELLTPSLVSTAKANGPGSARVVWVASSAAEMFFVPKGGMDMDNLNYHNDKSSQTKYSISKAGNFLHGMTYAQRHKADGVISVALNPGNLNSELWRTQPGAVQSVLRGLFLHPSINGAYTELFAGLSPDVTMEKTGSWIAPWGRFAEIRKDIQQGATPKSEGGLGVGDAFWNWTKEQIKPYL